MSDYAAQFLSPGEARTAVKALTARIESDLVRFTINAPDWYVEFPLIVLPTHLMFKGHIICRTNGPRFTLGEREFDLT